jgi:hypothetical protein
MKILKALVVGIVFFILWNSCTNHDLGIGPEDLRIDIRWVKGYPTETKEDVIKGLGWGLSFLGASLPPECLSTAVEWRNEKQFNLSLTKVGFNQEARAAWKVILDTLKKSDEYLLQGGIDLGRFVTLTLNSTNHYYAITGAKPRYADFRAQYHFEDKKAGIVKSAIAFGSRIIEISKAEQFNEIAFVATEGEGSLIENNFVEKEFEALDYMPNGQLRFALYDLNGNLKTSATKSLTAAGKPSKCLWCHETSLNPPFVDDNQLPGHYSTEEFKSILEDRTNIVTAYREKLESEINFSKIQDHTKAELLYLSFMEPSPERLAQEWGISIGEVQERLKDVPTHAHQEFSYLGDKLYHRKDIDHLASFKNIEVPDDPRNPSPYEPDFIP